MVQRKLLTAIAALLALSIHGASGASADDATPSATNDQLLRIRWRLEAMVHADGTLRTPEDPAVHTVQFLPGGRVTVQADCNTGTGEYMMSGATLSIRRLVTTLVGCPSGTFGNEYAAALSAATSYDITIADDANDHLTIMTADGGSLLFAPSLSGVVWLFERFQSGNGEETVADDPRRYTLEVLDDGSTRVRADCNRGKGTAKIDGSAMDLTVALTRMACPTGSLGTTYAGYLEEAVSWVIRDGHLHLSLPMDVGIASFRPDSESAVTPATPAS